MHAEVDHSWPEPNLSSARQDLPEAETNPGTGQLSTVLYLPDSDLFIAITVCARTKTKLHKLHKPLDHGPILKNQRPLLF